MAKMAPGDHLRMGYEAATHAVAVWLLPRRPLTDAPPQITAKPKYRGLRRRRLIRQPWRGH